MGSVGAGGGAGAGAGAGIGSSGRGSGVVSGGGGVPMPAAASSAPPSNGVPASLTGPPPHPGRSGRIGNRPTPKVSRRRCASGKSSRAACSAPGLNIVIAVVLLKCATLWPACAAVITAPDRVADLATSSRNRMAWLARFTHHGGGAGHTGLQRRHGEPPLSRRATRLALPLAASQHDVEPLLASMTDCSEMPGYSSVCDDLALNRCGGMIGLVLNAVPLEFAT